MTKRAFSNFGPLPLCLFFALHAANPGQLRAQAPVITTPPQDQVVMVGRSATLSVTATGAAPLGYEWRLGGTNLPGANFQTLQIPSVSPGHAGNYTVVVSNSGGSVTSTPARLVVIPVLPGAVDPSFNAGVVDDLVRSIRVLENDQIIIGGWFNTISGFLRNRIARLDSGGGLDFGFGPGVGPDGPVYTTAVQPDGKIIIGGSFFVINGTNRLNIARLNSNGTLDTTFHPGFGTDGPVWAIALESSGKIYIGGDFNAVNSAERNRIARLNSDGSLDNTFTAGIVNDSVRTIVVQTNGQLLVGGNFTFIGGLVRNRIARLNSDGSADSTFDPIAGPDGWVFALRLLPDGKALIGGSFGYFNGINRVGIARLNTNGTLDVPFNSSVNIGGGVAAITLQPNGKILIGGGFNQVGGRTRWSIARLDPNGSLDESFAPDPGADNWVESIALQDDGNVLIGGYFTTVNNTTRYRVARLIGGDPSPFAPILANDPVSQTVGEGVDVTFTVQAFSYPAPAYRWQRNGINIPGATNALLLLRNVRLTNAGNYTVSVSNSIGSVTSAVAVLTVQPAPTNPGAPDIGFYVGDGPNAPVHTVAAQSDGKVVIGGQFIVVDNVTRIAVARLNQDGSLDMTFNANVGPPNLVNTVALQNDKILIGGAFFSVNGITRNNFARLNADGSLDMGFGTGGGANSQVNAIVVQTNGQIVVGGYFSFMGSLLRPGVARLHGVGSVDTGFQPALDVQYNVLGLAVQSDGKIIAVGDFFGLMGVVGRIVRFNTNGSVDSSFNPGVGPNNSVRAVVVQPDGKVLIAGTFTKVNGITRNRVARLNSDGSVDPSFDPAFGPNDNVDAIALQPDGRIVIGGRFTAIHGLAYSFVARLNRDGGPDLTFDSGLGPNDRVAAVALAPGGKIIIGGEFTKVNGASRRYVARLFGGDVLLDGPVIVRQPLSRTVAAGEDVTFNVLASGAPQPGYQWQFNGVNITGANAWTLNLSNVRVGHAGAYTVIVSNNVSAEVSSPAFLTVAPPPRNPGAPDIGFYAGLGPNDRVNALAVQSDDKIIIGGAFTEVDGITRNRIARLNHNGSHDTTFDPRAGANDQVKAVAVQDDGRILIAGFFTTVNGTNRLGLARLHQDGSLDAEFAPEPGRALKVHALALQPNGQIIVGGAFNLATTGDGILRFNPNGTLDSAFRPVTEPYTYIYSLEVQEDGRILIGGQFTSVGGLSHMFVSRLNPDGSVDRTFNLTMGASSIVNALAVQSDARVLLGGDFQYVNAYPRNHIARLNADGSIDDNFHPGPGTDGTVHAITVQSDRKILVGGAFTTIGFAPRNRIARLNRNGSVDLGFDPGSGVTGGTSYIEEYGELVDLTMVSTIALQGDGRVIVGGDFTEVNGVTRRYVARLFNREPSAFLQVNALSSPDSTSVLLTWETGALQVADDLDGPWSDVANAESPYVFIPGGVQKFFRLKFN